MRTLLISSILGTSLHAESLAVPSASTKGTWLILPQGLANKRAERRTNAVHALRLLPNNRRAQRMAENALAGPGRVYLSAVTNDFTTRSQTGFESHA
jgi:hypothetical protein